MSCPANATEGAACVNDLATQSIEVALVGMLVFAVCIMLSMWLLLWIALVNARL
jgi:hypothetical protein